MEELQNHFQSLTLNAMPIIPKGSPSTSSSPSPNVPNFLPSCVSPFCQYNYELYPMVGRQKINSDYLDNSMDMS
jgi:hypothetical protein